MASYERHNLPPLPDPGVPLGLKMPLFMRLIARFFSPGMTVPGVVNVVLVPLGDAASGGVENVASGESPAGVTSLCDRLDS